MHIIETGKHKRIKDRHRRGSLRNIVIEDHRESSSQ